MKRWVIVTILFAATASQAQSLDILTNLHPRPKVSYFLSGSQMVKVDPSWSIEYDLWASGTHMRAVQYLERRLKQILGDTLPVYPIDTTQPGPLPTSNVILVGEFSSHVIGNALAKYFFQDSLSKPESYSLTIDTGRIILEGSDTNGTFDAVSTLTQLLAQPNHSIPALHINDWPDYPIRWVFSTHNLLVNSQITALEAIEDTMAAHKLNGLQQNDFKNNIYDVFQNPQNPYPQYFYNVDSLQSYSAKSNVELIPGLFPIGWSEGILFHDPDLAEGIPTMCNYYIEGDTGKLIGDPNVTLPQGDFENARSGSFPGWNWYDPTIFVDSTTAHSGRYSARATNFSDTTPNGRFIKLLTCKPHEGYHLSAWYKTQGFNGEFNLLAIGFHGNDSRALTYTQFSVPASSNGWQQANVIFNTLQYDSLYVYCGVWSGQSGTIWFDDFQIEDAGMTNLLRRASDMPTVTGRSGNFMEGRDYAMLVDSTMEKAQGTYPWHASPGFKVLAGSKIHNGDTVQVHFIRPNPVLNDPTGDGSTMVCVSEDTLYPILHDQMSRVDAQYHSNKYFMSHDEIREMNWDSACQSRKLSPAQLLADNVRKSDSVMHEVHPGAEVFDWSDMFDSLHNAHNNYYLVNGDLSGDWNLIPKDITIVNWNGGNMSRSLNFFSKLGFSQITSPYYDVQNTNNIRAWRLAMDTIPNMRGMMYTTWANDYSFLTPFADYAWSAGPMIVFQPLPVFENIVDAVNLDADVFPDAYLPSDSIVSVIASFQQTSFDTTVALSNPSASHYVARIVLPGGSYRYYLTARNAEGLSRTTPVYELVIANIDNVTKAQGIPAVAIFPDPVETSLTVKYDFPGSATVTIVDLMGRELLKHRTSSGELTMDIRSIQRGTYECIITDASGLRQILPFVKE